MSAENEPRILGLLCNWCSYAGADLAGVSRLQYPPNLRPLRVLCTGRIEPQYILRAFLSGMDGVMVLGCHPGDCHYISGNFYAEKKIMMLARLLDMTGLGSERLLLDWVSAAEATKFAEVVTQFSAKIKALGRLEVDDDLSLRLRAAERTVTCENIRTLVAKQLSLEQGENVYGDRLPGETFEGVLERALEGTFVRQLILEAIKDYPLSVPQIVEAIDESSEIVSLHLAGMWGRGEVILKDVEGEYPIFISS